MFFPFKENFSKKSWGPPWPILTNFLIFCVFVLEHRKSEINTEQTSGYKFWLILHSYNAPAINTCMDWPRAWHINDFALYVSYINLDLARIAYKDVPRTDFRGVQNEKKFSGGGKIPFFCPKIPNFFENWTFFPGKICSPGGGAAAPSAPLGTPMITHKNPKFDFPNFNFPNFNFLNELNFLNNPFPK